MYKAHVVRFAAAGAILSISLFVLLRSNAGQSPTDAGAGRVSIVKSCSPAFDRYTNQPSNAQQQWMQQHYDKMLVFTPYFDARTAWYPRGLIYIDGYAIYTGSTTGGLAIPSARPDWILKDAAHNRLYIPWGCDSAAHVCPQYAADISNPDYRQWWVDWARSLLARGTYAGIWIDDVNLDWRVSDGEDAFVAPVDVKTGLPMTLSDWRRYFVEFLEKIRRDLPGIEIAHNSIWYAGAPALDSDPYIQRQILAADTINIEHGVTDSGLTSGTGPFSLDTLLGFIERVNQKGTRVTIGGLLDPHDVAAVEYTVACYFLISRGMNSSGMNAIADAAFSSPDNWWTGLDVDLGSPLGPRQTWNGLMRRDFSGGMVLVNPPKLRAIAVDLPAPMRRVAGDTLTSVSLDSGRGIILLR